MGGKRGRGAAGKTIVMGFKERGGRLVTETIPNVKLATLRAETLKTVEAGATVSTDELYSYRLLKEHGYSHVAVKHGANEWAVYDAETDTLHHTNHVESFWMPPRSTAQLLFRNRVASCQRSIWLRAIPIA